MRRCFEALLSTVGLQLPVFPHVPFLACDLACLVCPVQIKLVTSLLDGSKDFRQKFEPVMLGRKGGIGSISFFGAVSMSSSICGSVQADPAVTNCRHTNISPKLNLSYTLKQTPPRRGSARGQLPRRGEVRPDEATTANS